MGRKQKASRFGEPDAAIMRAHRDLSKAGVLARVELGGADERAWLDCDLASLAENRLGDAHDPRALDDARRSDWSNRATSERLGLPSTREEFERCYWLLDQGRRAGTVALATSTLLGGTLVRLSSFYLFPDERGRGVARRALDRIRDALGARGFGVRLETCWTWQHSLRFYLRAGMWVRMWKRDVDLWCEAGVPAPSIDIGERIAILAVDLGSERVELVRAERDGARLVSCADTFRKREDKDPRLAAFAWDASTTLAVALAMHGWPLLESPETWERGWHGDAGHPAGLAYRIICWEAWEKKHGWRVETPRVPGLSYPTWEELDAD